MRQSHLLRISSISKHTLKGKNHRKELRGQSTRADKGSIQKGNVCGKDSVPPVLGGEQEDGSLAFTVPTLLRVSSTSGLYAHTAHTTLTRMMVQETPLALDAA